MRTFISGTGADVTATVKSYLQGNNEFYIADLLLIGEQEDPDALFLTSWPTPLVWNPWGTFYPTVMSRDKVDSTVGLEVTNMKVEWSPLIGDVTNTNASTSYYQQAYLGKFDNKRLRLWRTVMPTVGDANTYGAYELWGGWISTTTVELGKISFDANSFLNVINQKIPPNTIEGTNSMAGFMAGAPVLADGETNLPTFKIEANSTATILIAQCLQPTLNKIYGTHKLQKGFVFFITGSLKGFYSGVADNSNYNAGGGIHYNQIQVFTPFPWDPAFGDEFYVGTQPPVTSQDSVGGPFQCYNFPYLPDPETNI